MMSSSLKPLWIILLVAAGLAAVVGVSKWRQPKEIVPWRADFPAARAEAQKAGKPMFVYFGADWCEPCQAMRRTAFSDARVAAVLQTSFVPVHVDVDQHTDLVRQYAVTPANPEGGIPAFRVIDPATGNIVREITGGMETDQFLKWLQVN